MKKLLFPFIVICTILLSACSKEKAKYFTENNKGEIILSIANAQSKAIGAEHGIPTNDNTINTLDVFVFNSGGEQDGLLDGYARFTSNDGITNLKIKTTIGEKEIYVVANAHRANWQGITTLSLFKKEMADIRKDSLKNFIMTGSVKKAISISTSVTISISRLAARIKLASIKTNFKGTVYEGMNLKILRAYLINVHALKSIENNNSNTTILNAKKANTTDNNACAIKNMLIDNIQTVCSDLTPYITPHYFYSYENQINTETSSEKFTKLVVEASLNGQTYYYPVCINQEGYGYTASNGHYGIRRNTAYEINVTIQRPGSTIPDKPIEKGAISCTINVADWINTTVANPEF